MLYYRREAIKRQEQVVKLEKSPENKNLLERMKAQYESEMHNAENTMWEAPSAQKQGHAVTTDLPRTTNRSDKDISTGTAAAITQQKAEDQTQDSVPEQHTALKHGYGEISYPGGVIYCGEWEKAAAPSRSGSLARAKSSGWYRTLKHGYGEITYPSGASYSGEWREDQMCGYGIRTDIYGKKSCGQWQDGVLVKAMPEFAVRWKLSSIKAKAEKRNGA